LTVVLDPDGAGHGIVASHFDEEGGPFICSFDVLDRAALMIASEHFGAVKRFHIISLVGDPDISDGVIISDKIKIADGVEVIIRCEVGLPPLIACGLFVGDRARRRPVVVVGVRVDGLAILTS